MFLNLVRRVQQARQDVITPSTINFKTRLSKTFAFEAESREQASAPFVVGKMVSHDAMEIQFLEHKPNCCDQRFRHEPFVLLSGANRISEVTCLEGAPRDVGETADCNNWPFIPLTGHECHA